MARATQPVNPMEKGGGPFALGFKVAMRWKYLREEWPQIADELRELHAQYNTPFSDLQPKEIFRVLGAHAVTVPVFFQDSNGGVILAFQSSDGSVRVYRVGESEPIWIFPKQNLPTPGDQSQFVHLAWHADSRLGEEPSLYVYWLPLEKDDEHTTKNLYRSSARLGETSTNNLRVAIPPGVFVEGIHSLTPEHEFLVFTPIGEDENPQLIDIQNAAQPPLHLGLPPFSHLFVISEMGAPVVVRALQDQVEALQRTDGSWRSIWRGSCGGAPCVDASLYKSSRGELWVAYIDMKHKLTLQSLHRSEKHTIYKLKKPLVEPPLLYETAAGHLHALLEIDNLHDLPLGNDKKNQLKPVKLDASPRIFLSSSKVFSRGKEGAAYLGLVTTNGLEVYDPSAAGPSPALATVLFNGTERAAWWLGEEQIYFAAGSNPGQTQLVIYRLLAWR